MRRHPLRKFLGLTVLYAAVIIGIFVVQFKTESVISRTFELFNYTLAQSQGENNEIHLKNQFRAAFRGFVILFDDKTPATGTTEDGTVIPLVLESYEEQENHSVKINFKDGSYCIFTEVPDINDGNESHLAIVSVPSPQLLSMEFPYKTTSGLQTELKAKNSLALTTKSDEFRFSAHEITDSTIVFTRLEPIAKFERYVESKVFTFEAVAGLSGTTAESFSLTAKHLRDSYIRQIHHLLTEEKTDMLSEQNIAAYIAEMAAQGRYNTAIDSIPDSFKNGNKRTYFTSPYFNHLAAMSKSLDIQTEKFETLVASKSIDAFTAEGITDYILRCKKTSAVQQLLYTPASIKDFNPNVRQAAGIVSVYADIYNAAQNLAAYLEPAVEICIKKLQDNCVLSDDGKLSLLMDEHTPAEDYDSICAGNALVKIGNLRESTQLKEAGYLLMNSVLGKESTDYRLVSAVYTILAPENFFYPHTEILAYNGTEAVWAWTCAKKITWEKEDDITTIMISFPLNLTHYIMMGGVPDFHGRIEIQGIMFRTDPRFETYNSSGYVYQAPKKTLLLKSRHKSADETIRLFFKAPEPKPAPKPAAAPKPAPAPQPAKTPAPAAGTAPEEAQPAL